MNPLCEILRKNLFCATLYVCLFYNKSYNVLYSTIYVCVCVKKKKKKNSTQKINLTLTSIGCELVNCGF